MGFEDRGNHAAVGRVFVASAQAPLFELVALAIPDDSAYIYGVWVGPALGHGAMDCHLHEGPWVSTFCLDSDINPSGRSPGGGFAFSGFFHWELNCSLLGACPQGSLSGHALDVVSHSTAPFGDWDSCASMRAPCSSVHGLPAHSTARVRNVDARVSLGDIGLAEARAKTQGEVGVRHRRFGCRLGGGGGKGYRNPTGGSGGLVRARVVEPFAPIVGNPVLTVPSLCFPTIIERVHRTFLPPPPPQAYSYGATFVASSIV